MAEDAILAGDQTALAIRVLRLFAAGEGPLTSADSLRIAGRMEALERRALRAEELLSSMMLGGQLTFQALGEATEMMGYLHACMFGAEQHLREHGWLKPVDTYPDDERPF